MLSCWCSGHWCSDTGALTLVLYIANDNYVIIDFSPDIVVKNHFWVCADTGDAGNAIDFFVRIKGTSFQEAMQLLTS